MEMNCPPEILARDFADNVMIGGLMSPDTIWEAPQQSIAPKIDYLKIVMWMVGALFPWVGIAALLIRLG